MNSADPAEHADSVWGAQTAGDPVVEGGQISADTIAAEIGEGAAKRPQATTIGVPRVIAAALAAIAAVGPPLIGLSGAWLFWSLAAGSALAAVVLAGPAERRGRLSVAGWLPFGFLVVTFWAIAAGVLAAAFDLSLWGSRSSALATWAVMLVAGVAVAARRGGRVRVMAGDGPAVAVSATMAGIGLLVVALLPFEVWSRNVAAGTDFSRHLAAVGRIAEGGQLSYASESYPRGIHTAIGWLWSASGGTGYADGWAAMESAVWLMLALMAAALTVAAGRALRALATASWLRLAVVPVIVLLVFLQSMWVTQMMPSGFVTTVAAGLIIAAVLASSLDGAWFSSDRSIWTGAVAVVVLVHAWPLLAPVVALPWGLALVSGLRRRRWLAVAGAVGLSAVALPAGLAVVRDLGADVSGALATYGNASLWWPQWWWAVALALTIVGVVVCFRDSGSDYGAVMTALLIGGVGTLGTIALLGGISLASPSYYFIKTLWTLMVILIPGSLVGGLWLADRWFTFAVRRRSGGTRLVGLAAVTGLVVLGVAAVSGWMFGYPSLALNGAKHGFGLVPFQIPVVTAMESQVERYAPGTVALVWGVAPYGTAESLHATAPYPDWYSREAMEWLGMRGVLDGTTSAALMNRDGAAACELLRQFPDAIRITGPYAPAGAQWLLDSGCPTTVVRPEQWHSVPVDDAWFAQFSFQGQPYEYPTFDEWEELLSRPPEPDRMVIAT